MLRLRPGLHRLRRRPGRQQLGLDARDGVVLDGLTATDERLLDALAGGCDGETLRRLACLDGVAQERVDALLAALRAAGALAPPPTVRSRLARLPDDLRQRLGRDAVVLGLAHRDGDGWHVLAPRRDRCVAVVGAGRTGLAVAVGLAAAGTGCVLVEDDEPVGTGDLSPGGYSPATSAARGGLPRASCWLAAAPGPGPRPKDPPGPTSSCW